jgi:hypothetical protein
LLSDLGPRRNQILPGTCHIDLLRDRRTPNRGCRGKSALLLASERANACPFGLG